MKLAIATMAVLIPFLASDSRADCPTTLMWSCGSDAGIPSNLAGATFDGGNVVAWSAGDPILECGYDIVHGAIEAIAYGDALYSDGCGAGAWMVDDYWINGPPSGHPLSFEPVLIANAAITGTCYANGDITVYAENRSNGFSTGNSGPQTVEIGLTKGVGEVFQLETRLEATTIRAVGSTHVTGTLRFRGLPDGYSVVSCHGYALPTPARPSTWGGLKAVYR